MPDINEAEAYLVAAYMLITAKVVQVPLLKWVAQHAVDYEGCDTEYATALNKFIMKFKNSNDKYSKKQRSTLIKVFLVSGFVIISGGSGILFVTTMTGGAAYLFNNTIKNALIHDENLRSITEANLTTGLLLESRDGGGANYEKIMPHIWEITNRYDISPSELANLGVILLLPGEVLTSP